MSVNPAPINDGQTPATWAIWFQSVTNALRVQGRSFTVAALPTNVERGLLTFASNGRKSGEGAGAGTGCPVWFDGTVWRTFYDNSQVAA